MEKVPFRHNMRSKISIKEVKPPYKNFCPLEYPDQLWNTRSDGTLDIGHVNDEPSLTQQQFKDECDINNIMKSYQETGTINHLNPRTAVYGDFHDVKDFKESLELVQAANETFMLLPATIRTRFENDPAKLVEFCNDPNNLEEAIQLGLAEKPLQVTNANDDQTTNANQPKQKQQKPAKEAVTHKTEPGE